jgi:biotin carboxylase
MVANVNLPAAQLMIAMGIPLHRIKSIRSLYGHNESLDTVIDFATVVPRPVPSGHVISARITSENPDEGFKPTSGENGQWSGHCYIFDKPWSTVVAYTVHSRVPLKPLPYFRLFFNFRRFLTDKNQILKNC